MDVCVMTSRTSSIECDAAPLSQSAATRPRLSTHPTGEDGSLKRYTLSTQYALLSTNSLCVELDRISLRIVAHRYVVDGVSNSVVEKNIYLIYNS